MEAVVAELTTSDRLIAIKKKLTAEDISRGCLLAKRSRVTLDKYLAGTVTDAELGERLADFFEACGAINDEARRQKEALNF